MEKKEINRKFGMEPGAIIYTGEKDKDHPTFIQYYKYNENSHEFKEEAKVSDLNLDENKNTVNWINIDGIHDTEIIKEIGEKFKIDNFVLEDIVNIEQRPKVDEKENFIFIVVKMLRYDEELQKIISEQVSIIVGHNYLMSFQEEKGDVFGAIRNRIKSGDWIRKKN
ncbi:MAG: CorA family divalent cation transporter, partial [Fusobacteriaceae bacterium]